MQNSGVAKEARQEGWGMPETRKQTLAGTKGIIPFSSGTSFGLLPLVEHEPPNIQRLAVHRTQGQEDNKAPYTSFSFRCEPLLLLFCAS